MTIRIYIRKTRPESLRQRSNYTAVATRCIILSYSRPFWVYSTTAATIGVVGKQRRSKIVNTAEFGMPSEQCSTSDSATPTCISICGVCWVFDVVLLALYILLNTGRLHYSDRLSTSCSLTTRDYWSPASRQGHLYFHPISIHLT